MASKTEKSDKKVSAPKYTIEKPKSASSAVAKLFLPKTSAADIHKNIDALINAARADGKTINFLRGTLTAS